MFREGIGPYKGRRKDTGGWIDGYLVTINRSRDNNRAFICPTVLSAHFDGAYTFGPFYEVDPLTVELLGG